MIRGKKHNGSPVLRGASGKVKVKSNKMCDAELSALTSCSESDCFSTASESEVLEGRFWGQRSNESDSDSDSELADRTIPSREVDEQRSNNDRREFWVKRSPANRYNRNPRGRKKVKRRKKSQTINVPTYRKRAEEM